MFTLLLEYPSIYTDFKQDASRLEPMIVWLLWGGFPLN